MTIWGERFAAATSVLFAFFVIYVAWNYPANGDLFPKFCGFAMIAIAGLMVVRTISSPAVFSGGLPQIDWLTEFKPLLITSGVIAYVLIFFKLGYYTSSAIFLCAMAWIAGVRSIKTIVITALVTFPLMYAFFELFLQARMPRGILI
jgi:hypothetical protein